MYSLGIDAGAGSVKLAAVDVATGELVFCARAPHRGSVVPTVCELLEQALMELGPHTCAGVVVTGSNAALLAGFDLSVLEDVPALVRGASLVAPQARSIIDIGAQNARFVYGLEQGSVPGFALNESCASGTGSFFEDQMTRLGLDIEDFSGLVAQAQTLSRISGRCSVFAKTDIIHRQQEGVPVEDILLGLCYAMVKSFKALIVRGAPVEAPVLLCGGVLLNQGVLRAMREVFSLADDELLATEGNLYVQAAGAALEAAEQADEVTAFDLERLAAKLRAGSAASEGVPRLAPLPDNSYVAGCGFDALPHNAWEADADGLVHATLGIDVGSTSTNLVLLDRKGRILDAQYLRTAGDARNAVRDGLASLEARVGGLVAVDAVTTTGSGRNLMAKFVGADSAVDEITCQAVGAAHVDPLVDTVFEIGGQDSKYIALDAGQVVDFQMNKVCAAGTGSFIEEQAARLGIPLSSYGPLALNGTAPVDLGERCTVFVETAINAALGAGANKADIAAGLALSIVRNYLHRVVGSKRVGGHIVLQGGVAYNPAIVEAFRSFYDGALTVSPNFAVSGAVGAALMAAEAAAAPGFAGSTFKGFDLSGAAQAHDAVDQEAVALNRAFYDKTEELYLAGYTGQIDPAKKTVGIPRCLMLHRLFPMANQFFQKLGYNVLLSPNSSEEQVRLAQENARGETCYPVKLIFGHMAWLAERGVDYIFMPSLHTIRHASSKTLHNYACAYMQTAPRFVADALGFEARGIELLNPVLDMDFGQQAMATAMLSLGTQLGHTPQDTARAMMAGGFAVNEFGAATERLGDELLASLGPHERVLVLITRNYGISDNALNMGIPQILLDHGQKVITLAHLHGHDIDVSTDHPGICWPFGQHILSGAKLIRRDPRLFAVYLTNHGCGPDTTLDKLFAEEMGAKPYLQIECDEHFSKVGVTTRIEAFLNALAHTSEEEAVRLSTVEPVAPNELALSVVPEEGEALCSDGVASEEAPSACAAEDACADGGALSPLVVVPQVGPYGSLIAAALRTRGFDAATAPLDAAALELGRGATSSKEYCSFTVLLGMALKAAEVARREGKPLHLLLPATRGTEADNQYDRVIRAVLKKRGYGDVKIWAPRLETLPASIEEALGEGAAQAFTNLLLAGDAELALPPSLRAGFRSLCLNRMDECGAAGLDVSWLVEQLEGLVADSSLEADGLQIHESSDAPSSQVPGAESPSDSNSSSMQSPQPLMLVGEWPLVYDDRLTGGLWCVAETAGHPVLRMPFSEWFAALMLDAVREDEAILPQRKKDAKTDEALQTAERAEARAAFCKTVAEASVQVQAKLSQALDQALGYTPFAQNLEDLTAKADELLPQFSGANARYRAAKQELSREDGVPIVTAASLYENVDTMLRLKEEGRAWGRGTAGKAPVLHLNFDGVLDQSTTEKLSTYLYYLRR